METVFTETILANCHSQHDNFCFFSHWFFIHIFQLKKKKNTIIKKIKKGTILLIIAIAVSVNNKKILEFNLRYDNEC